MSTTQTPGDPFSELAAIREALSVVDIPPWHLWPGHKLLEFHLGLRYPRKLRRLIDELYSCKVTRYIVAGPRGGGKSMLDAAIEFVVWLFLDFDVVNIGGSEGQARGVYNYLQQFVDQYRQSVQEWPMGGRVKRVDMLKDTMSLSTRRVDPFNLHRPEFFGDESEIEFTGTPLAKDSQAFIAVLAASPKQVRGPHAGSEMRGGLLVVDEEGEVEGKIFNAAQYTINTANPSIVLRTSTYHNATGTFAEDFEDPEAKGFKRLRFSIFDVVKTCPYAKTTPEDWADIDAGRKRVPGDEEPSLLHLPMVQPDCTDCPQPKYFRDTRIARDPQTGEMKPVGQPWCGGAAAYTENGWISWEELFKEFNSRPNDEDFEVELLGLRPSSLGYVVTDRDALNRAVMDDDECKYIPPYYFDAQGRRHPNENSGEVIITIDWGMSGSCAVNAIQNRNGVNPPYGRRVIVQSDDLGQKGDTEVYQHCEDLRELYGTNEIWADSSHPYQNRALAAKGFDVHIVYFAKYKEHGAGSINMHLFHSALGLPRGIASTLIRQLRGWRRDKNGKIVKGDDHFPDSLLCGMLRYLDMVMYMLPDDRPAQPRKSAIVNAAARAKDQDEQADGRRGELPGAQPQYEPMTARQVATVSAMHGAPHDSPAMPLYSPQEAADAFQEVVPSVMRDRPETTTERLLREASEQARTNTPRRFK